MRRDSLPIHAVEEPRRVRIRGIVDGLLTLSPERRSPHGAFHPAGTLPSAERIAPLKYTPRVGRRLTTRFAD